MIQRYTYNSAGGGASITPPTSGSNTLLVIDYLCYALTQSATIVGMSVTINGVIVAARGAGAGAGSGKDGLYVDFPGGYPVWSVADDDSSPLTGAINITGTCTGSTGNTIFIGYHFENPGWRRTRSTEPSV